MPTTPSGIWTPDDTTGWNLTVDLAAMANSIDAAIDVKLKATSTSVASAAARNALFPTPAQGNRVFRNDLGYGETYYAPYNAGSNPGGRAVAGWYSDAPITTVLGYPGVSVANGSPTAFVSAGATFDTAMSSTGYANSFATTPGNRLMLRNAGMYSFGADIQMVSGGGTRNFADIKLFTNTGTAVRSFRGTFGSGEDKTSPASPSIIKVNNPGSYLELAVFQNSGSAVTISGSIYATFISPLT